VRLLTRTQETDTETETVERKTHKHTPIYYVTPPSFYTRAHIRWSAASWQQTSDLFGIWDILFIQEQHNALRDPDVNYAYDQALVPCLTDLLYASITGQQVRVTSEQALWHAP
jgi:hypothetical protein